MSISTKKATVSNYQANLDEGIIKCRFNNFALPKISPFISFDITHYLKSYRTSVNKIWLKENKRLKNIQIKPCSLVNGYDKYKIILHFKHKNIDFNILIACYYDTDDEYRYWFHVKLHCPRFASSSVFQPSIPFTYKDRQRFMFSSTLKTKFNIEIPIAILNNIFSFSKTILNGAKCDITEYFDKYYNLYGAPFITNMPQITDTKYFIASKWYQNDEIIIDTIQYVTKNDIKSIKTQHNLFVMKIVICMNDEAIINNKDRYSLLNLNIGDVWYLNRVSQFIALKELCVALKDIDIKTTLILNDIEYSEDDIFMLWIYWKSNVEMNTDTDEDTALNIIPLPIEIADDVHKSQTTQIEERIYNGMDSLLFNHCVLNFNAPTSTTMEQTMANNFVNGNGILDLKNAIYNAPIYITWYDVIGLEPNRKEIHRNYHHLSAKKQWNNKTKYKQHRLYASNTLKYKYHRW